MPIFEYICNSCEHRFELLVISNNNTKETTCPECASTDVKKIISAPIPSINLASDSAKGCNPKSPFS